MPRRYSARRRGPSSAGVARPQIIPSLFSTTTPNEDPNQPLQAQRPVETIDRISIHDDDETPPSQPNKVEATENMPSVTRRPQSKMMWSEVSDYATPAVGYNVPPNIFTDERFERSTFSNVPRYGMPRVAEPTHMIAPVHIDVGGSIYTTSLGTLFVFPNSRLGRMFSGSIPLVLDGLKQHYFIDRDGIMFRHILNYLRNRRLILPHNFADYDLLVTEAEYFGLHQMVEDLIHWKAERDLRMDIEWNINGNQLHTQVE